MLVGSFLFRRWRTLLGDAPQHGELCHLVDMHRWAKPALLGRPAPLLHNWYCEASSCPIFSRLMWGARFYW